MYMISTTPGDRVETAATIPDALAVLAAQLTTHLPNGPVAWKITDPSGDRAPRAVMHSTDRLDLLTIAASTNSLTSCTPNCIVLPMDRGRPPATYRR